MLGKTEGKSRMDKTDAHEALGTKHQRRHLKETWFDWFMVLNVTFNNISVISWRLVLLVKKTGVPRVYHWPVSSHWQTFIT